MAHTCPQCGSDTKILVAPTEEGYENLKSKNARRINGHYNHDFRSWKRATKARKQWAKKR